MILTDSVHVSMIFMFVYMILLLNKVFKFNLLPPSQNREDTIWFDVVSKITLWLLIFLISTFIIYNNKSIIIRVKRWSGTQDGQRRREGQAGQRQHACCIRFVVWLLAFCAWKHAFCVPAAHAATAIPSATTRCHWTDTSLCSLMVMATPPDAALLVLLPLIFFICPYRKPVG